MTGWRDVYETGEPPTRARRRYAEHMNTLAERGTANGPMEAHHTYKMMRRDYRYPAPLSDEERALAEAVWAQLSQSEFDAMFRATVAQLRPKPDA